MDVNAHFYIIDKDNVGLAEHFSVNPSSCGNSEFYKEYLMYSALNDFHSGKNTTHLFIDETKKRIMGFVSLRANSIISNCGDDNIRGIPALEVSVLAVDKDYEGKGVGTALIDYVLYQANELHNRHIGLQYIILAADKKAEGFYEHMNFTPIKNSWEQIPKEHWSTDCVPMSLGLGFEAEYIEKYNDDEE